ncbi:YraN family protein [Vallitalea okinawensis]|uniref:YraN family protein n=1 Tax=Vallitalea okinawensis TaxID=2078660 RepID=UPI000CFB5C72|nr:YraN family protein [Vallitalea okinawensis]
MKVNKKVKGDEGEKRALNYLLAKGYTIKVKNYRCPYGEIDLIAMDDNTFVFVEVKYRKSIRYGYPREAVNGYKRQKIYKTALWYISSYQLESNFRFDVIEILGDQIEHIVDAFQV